MRRLVRDERALPRALPERVAPVQPQAQAAGRGAGAPIFLRLLPPFFCFFGSAAAPADSDLFGESAHSVAAPAPSRVASRARRRCEIARALTVASAPSFLGMVRYTGEPRGVQSRRFRGVLPEVVIRTEARAAPRLGGIIACAAPPTHLAQSPEKRLAQWVVVRSADGRLPGGGGCCCGCGARRCFCLLSVRLGCRRRRGRGCWSGEGGGSSQGAAHVSLANERPVRRSTYAFLYCVIHEATGLRIEHLFLVCPGLGSSGTPQIFHQHNDERRCSCAGAGRGRSP